MASAACVASVPLDSWMQKLPPQAKSRSICELALPGAHNAGASEVKCISPLVANDTGGYLSGIARSGVANAIARPIAGAIAVCQSDGIGELLRKGVRLLDLRLGRHDGQLYICHTVVCNRSFCSVLEEVAEFLREQPEEVVVLLVMRDWGAREYFDTEENWSEVQDLLEAFFGHQLLQREDLPASVSALVQRGRRVLAMLELPGRLRHTCGVRLTSENLRSSWRDATRALGDMVKDWQAWHQAGRLRPEKGCLKVLEACLPGGRLGPSVCVAFRKFLEEHSVHVATKFDFPDAETIRALVAQNWYESSEGHGQEVPNPKCARDVSHVFEKLGSLPGGNCLDRLKNMSELLSSCTSTPFLGIVYGGRAGGQNWGYAVTKCITSKKSWISDVCYCYLELPTSSSSSALAHDEFCQGCEESIRQSIATFPDGSKDNCIERASFIAKAMSEKAGMCCYAICKRSPGGFDQWAYQGPTSSSKNYRFHEWRETSTGLFGLGAVSHCFAVQLY